MAFATPGRSCPQTSAVRVAGFIDVETTGLDPASDEVIELAIALVGFDANTGAIAGVLEEYVGLRDPGRPIPPDAARVHGIRDRDVRGKRLDDDRVRAMLERAEFLVAHNASFDRAFVTKLYPEARRKRWLCSMRSIPWKELGYSSRSLHYLLRAHGIALEQSHRGLDDVKALVTLLSRSDGNGGTYFYSLVQKSSRRRPTKSPRKPAATPEQVVTRDRRVRAFEPYIPVLAEQVTGRPLPSLGALVLLPFRLLLWIVKAPFLLPTWLLRRGSVRTPKSGRSL